MAAASGAVTVTASGTGATVDPERLVLVPLLRGLRVDAASRILDWAGLELGAHRGRGRVVSQSPGRGVLVKPGTAIDVRLASVPARPRVVVPLLVGGTVAEARAELAAVGLVLAGDPASGSTIGA